MFMFCSYVKRRIEPDARQAVDFSLSWQPISDPTKFVICDRRHDRSVWKGVLPVSRAALLTLALSLSATAVPAAAKNWVTLDYQLGRGGQ
jgi:hypothetical protein